MSPALSSVRGDLAPAVSKDVENFFLQNGQSFLIGHRLPVSLGTLWPSSQKMFLFEAWAVSEPEESSRDAVIEV